MNHQRIFISTAIPYVNADPHLGFALELIQTDAYARYQRLKENKVYFLTGTDENALKNVRAAQEQHKDTASFVAANTEKFRSLKKTLNISYDDFIRTTEKRHVEGAQKFWKACEKDIYKKKYRGLYCVGCEAFYAASELECGVCPEHNTVPEEVEEENYFFRLSKYEKEVRALIEKDKILLHPSRKNEVLAFINRGLEDFSISRSALRAHAWGIPVPHDTTQTMYVWFDALTNYINGLGYATEEAIYFKNFWQDASSRTIHVIGKGVLRFHAVYWPAMLLSAGLRPPTDIIVHGYITVEGKKMSKSLGNVLSPDHLVREWGIDAIRYFLLREFSPWEDGDFSRARILERYNADLAHGLGNLISRSLTLIAKEQIALGVNELSKNVAHTWEAYHKYCEGFSWNMALESIWQLIRATDRYIHAAAPWKLDDARKKSAVLSSAWYSLANIAHMLMPFMPETAVAISSYLDIPSVGAWEGYVPATQKPMPLFPIKH